MNGKFKLMLAGCAASVAMIVPASANAATGTFTATGPNAVPGSGDSGTAAIYPWNVTVSGLTGSTDDVDVSLKGFSHNKSPDVDALLVAPNGAGSVNFMSDLGDSASPVGPFDIGFDDAAFVNAPIGAPLTAGIYKPSDYDPAGDTDSFPAAPSGSHSKLSSLDGHNPNGTWSLYLADDGNDLGSTGSLQGYALTIATTTSKPHRDHGKRKRKCKKRHFHRRGPFARHSHKHKCGRGHHHHGRGHGHGHDND